jgi:hypothetical protein
VTAAATRTQVLNVVQEFHKAMQGHKPKSDDAKSGDKRKGDYHGSDMEEDPRLKNLDPATQPFLKLLYDSNDRLTLELQMMKSKLDVVDLAKEGGSSMAGAHAALAQDATLKALLQIVTKMEKAEDRADGSSSIDSSKQGIALSEKLAKVLPHLVKMDYKGDPEAFGLHVALATEYCSTADPDSGVVALFMNTQLRKKEILVLFRTNHHEALQQMNILILLILGWASDYEVRKGIIEAKTARADQMRNYNAAFAKMQEQLHEYTDNLARGEEFLQRQVLLFANAVMGTMVALSAFKSMDSDKADE